MTRGAYICLASLYLAMGLILGLAAGYRLYHAAVNPPALGALKPTWQDVGSQTWDGQP